MKILVVMNYRPCGGLTEAVRQLIESLRQEGFSVEHISTYGRIRQRIAAFFRVTKRAALYDFIIASGCADYGFFPIIVGVIAARLNRKKFLIDYHTGYPGSFMKQCGKLLKLFLGNAVVVVASSYLLENFKKFNCNAQLIPYHFHFENFPRRRRSFRWNTRIVWAGTFDFLYDPETALRAAKLVLGERQDIEFHFFGRGKQLNDLKKKYRHPNIKFRDLLSREKFIEELGEFSIFINSSFGDNFPLRVVDAAYNELLVISARAGGIPTIYSDQECLFFEKGDYHALGRHILDVLNNPGAYDSLRHNIHQRVLDFTWDKVRDKWLKLLEA